MSHQIEKSTQNGSKIFNVRFEPVKPLGRNMGITLQNIPRVMFLDTNLKIEAIKEEKKKRIISYEKFQHQKSVFILWL